MSLDLGFDCFAGKEDLGASFVAIFDRLMVDGYMRYAKRYGGGKFRTDPSKEAPFIMPVDGHLYETDLQGNTEGALPEVTLAFAEEIVESPYVLKFGINYKGSSGRYILMELCLWGTHYRGWPREAVSFVFDDGDIAKRWLEEDRELFLNGTYVRQDVAFERWIKSPDLAVGEYEIGPQYLHAGHSRNSDTMELFLLAAGCLGKEGKTPAFSDIVAGEPPAIQFCAAFHRSMKGFALDFLRTWAARNNLIDHRLLYPEFGWEELAKILDENHPDPRYIYSDGPVFEGDPVIPELIPDFINRLLDTPETVYHQRMRTLCAKIPQCAWFDFGKRGVAICMPPYVPLVNAYRVLAGLEIQ